MNATTWVAQIRDLFHDEPLTALALTAALVALATTPIAFAVLGRLQWFKARRGRVMQTPGFSSVVCGMLLVMGIPAIFSALVLKSRHFDKNRYEFDPNKTWSVLEQGRGFKEVREADAAVKREQARLAEERKKLVESVKKLDESMLALRVVAGTSPAVAQKIPSVLQRLADVRKSVGVDGPQQLMDFTAPPAEIASAVVAPAGTAVAAPAPAAGGAATAPASAPAAAPVAGLPKAQAEAELATAPQPQKAIAAMLPLTDIPAGWSVGKSGERYLETFNAENLFEKIDGRAESFLQYDVKGMAYTNYQPDGDTSNDVQVYIFELGNSLKALGKYGSEKPEEAKPLAVGSEGYTAGGSTLFYAGKYYTQIVTSKDEPKFAAFALDLARRIAAKQAPGGAPVAAAATPGGAVESTAESLFALLPAGSGKGNTSYVAQDVFGYSFLSDVFLADYAAGGVTWKGFVRPYASPDEAKAVFEKYLASAKQDGADIKEVKTEGADRMIVASNIGLVDALFLKGNTLAGAAGSTTAKPAEEYARKLAKSLPAKVPTITTGKPAASKEESAGPPGEGDH
jgi:hypothetical protein